MLEKTPPHGDRLLVNQLTMARMLGFSRITFWRLLRAGVVAPEFGYGKAARYFPAKVFAALAIDPPELSSTKEDATYE